MTTDFGTGTVNPKRRNSRIENQLTRVQRNVPVRRFQSTSCTARSSRATHQTIGRFIASSPLAFDLSLAGPWWLGSLGRGRRRRSVRLGVRRAGRLGRRTLLLVEPRDGVGRSTGLG